MVDHNRWSRMDELLDAALDLPSGERSRWLEAVCQDDELRREVARLLALSEREDDALQPQGALAGPLWDEIARDLETVQDTEDLPSGHTLGDYRIQGVLGRGGTGTVYRATDPRLEREVAVKALSRGFAEGSPGLRRLEREARLLASLNHPNIAVVYELLFVENTPYLVLELVQGESLAERIARGPLPVSEAIRVAGQVAEALEEAYRNGVVHRDLKPGNVMLTLAGRVKVLDFGLAKGRTAASPDIMPSLPGRIPRTTRDGMVMGTPAYMSPEQARGEVVDHRTDVWALGCILYEMITGHRTFRGETVTETLAAVLRDEVDWSRLPASTPPTLRRLLRRCLQKDPRLRLQDVGDARIELGEMTGEIPGRAWSLGLERWRRPARGRGRTHGGPRRVLRAARDVSADARRNLIAPAREHGGGPGHPALGRRVAFPGDLARRLAARVRGRKRRADAALRTRAGLVHTDPARSSEDARAPFYSPTGDGSFFAQGELRKVATAGGTPEKIASGGLQSRARAGRRRPHRFRGGRRARPARRGRDRE